MNGVLVLIAGIAILIIAYLTYGKWLAKQWGIDPSRETPSHTEEDGIDYVPAKAPVLMGHHFSSIAGAGPINGPIQAAVFGWVPVFLWVLIGGIFFGAVHDFGALFASIRNKGQSIGEVIASTMGSKAKKLFIIFSYLTLILVVAAFGSIVANTFMATYTESGAVDYAASAANATTAMISILFIIIAIAFGFLVYRRNAGLAVSTVIGVAAIVVCMVIGLNWHPLYLSNTAWMIIVGIYILAASVAPVWILLQPRDYLSSFLLYFMMIVAVVGIIGCGFTGGAHMDIPAFAGFKDTLAPTGASLGYMFPALFVTIACGAISGFHSLVGSGTTAKQLNNEKDAADRIRRYADRVCTGYHFPVCSRVYLGKLCIWRDGDAYGCICDRYLEDAWHDSGACGNGRDRVYAARAYCVGLLPDVPGHGDSSGKIYVPGILAGAR